MMHKWKVAHLRCLLFYTNTNEASQWCALLGKQKVEGETLAKWKSARITSVHSLVIAPHLARGLVEEAG